jgi:hypothetical protein
MSGGGEDGVEFGAGEWGFGDVRRGRWCGDLDAWPAAGVPVEGVGDDVWEVGDELTAGAGLPSGGAFGEAGGEVGAEDGPGGCVEGEDGVEVGAEGGFLGGGGDRGGGPCVAAGIDEVERARAYTLALVVLISRSSC